MIINKSVRPTLLNWNGDFYFHLLAIHKYNKSLKKIYNCNMLYCVYVYVSLYCTLYTLFCTFWHHRTHLSKYSGGHGLVYFCNTSVVISHDEATPDPGGDSCSLLGLLPPLPRLQEHFLLQLLLLLAGRLVHSHWATSLQAVGWDHDVTESSSLTP